MPAPVFADGAGAEPARTSPRSSRVRPRRHPQEAQAICRCRGRRDYRGDRFGLPLDMSGSLQLAAGPAGLSAGPFPASLGPTLLTAQQSPSGSCSTSHCPPVRGKRPVRCAAAPSSGPHTPRSSCPTSAAAHRQRRSNRRGPGGPPLSNGVLVVHCSNRQRRATCLTGGVRQSTHGLQHPDRPDASAGVGGVEP